MGLELGADHLVGQAALRGRLRRRSVEVTSFGNVLSAVAFLHGLATSELTERELDQRSPAYELVVAVRAVKRD